MKKTDWHSWLLGGTMLLLLLPSPGGGHLQEEELEFSRRRYLKGLDMLRQLHEKILALDHHFYAMQTGQRVLELGNPNAFPEFQKHWEQLTQSLTRRQDLPASLRENPYALTSLGLMGAYQGRSTQPEALEALACILDFTVQLQTDLRLIHVENELLCRDIQQLRRQCAQLFADYVRPLEYSGDLDQCRRQDEWEQLRIRLDDYFIRLRAARRNPAQVQEAYRQQIHLEFAVDRLLEFLRMYSAFIRQSAGYYVKFDAVLEQYARGNPCTEQMPPRFHRLREDLRQAVHKFHDAYDLAEFQGSRMKDLLYGFAD